MNDLEFIAELDKRIEIIQDAWAEDLTRLENDKRIQKDSAKYNKQVDILAEKYAPILAEILNERQEAYSREAKKQEKEYFAQYNEENNKEDSLVDEYGRPKGYIWKDGAWQARKKKSDDNL